MSKKIEVQLDRMKEMEKAKKKKIKIENQIKRLVELKSEAEESLKIKD